MLFHSEDADSHVTHEGKLSKLLDVVAAQRHKQPDARVAYHTLKDSPQPGRPSWFALDLKFQVYFRAENVPSKAAEGNETTPKVALGHLAGCLKPSAWETAGSSVVCAVKWNPSAEKGLTPLRPQVLTKVTIQLPPQQAVELTGNPRAEA